MGKGFDMTMPDISGVPEGSLISVRVGNTRRQAFHGSNRPLKFPGMHGKRELMRVDVFYPIAQAKLSIEPANIKHGHSWSVPLTLPSVLQHKLDVPSLGAAVRDVLTSQSTNMSANFAFSSVGDDDGGKDPMPCDMSEKDPIPCEMSCDGEAEQNGVANWAHVPKQSSARRHQVAVGESYLQEHQVVEVIRDMLQMLLKDKPLDPYEYMSHFLAISKISHKDVISEASPQAVDSTLDGEVRHEHLRTRAKTALESAYTIGQDNEAGRTESLIDPQAASQSSARVSAKIAEEQVAPVPSSPPVQPVVATPVPPSSSTGGVASPPIPTPAALAPLAPPGGAPAPPVPSSGVPAPPVPPSGGPLPPAPLAPLVSPQLPGLPPQSGQAAPSAASGVAPPPIPTPAPLAPLAPPAGGPALPAPPGGGPAPPVPPSGGPLPPAPLAPVVSPQLTGLAPQCEQTAPLDASGMASAPMSAPTPTPAPLAPLAPPGGGRPPPLPPSGGPAPVALSSGGPLPPAPLAPPASPQLTGMAPQCGQTAPADASVKSLAPPPIADKAPSRASSSVVADVFEYPLDGDSRDVGGFAGEAVSRMKETVLEKVGVEAKDDWAEKVRVQLRSALSEQTTNGKLPKALSTSLGAAVHQDEASRRESESSVASPASPVPPASASDKDDIYHDQVRTSLGQQLMMRARTDDLRQIFTRRGNNPQASSGIIETEESEESELAQLKSRFRSALVQHADRGILEQTLEQSKSAEIPDGSLSPSQQDEQNVEVSSRSRKRQSSWCAEVDALKEETSDLRSKAVRLEERLNHAIEENKNLKELVQEFQNSERLPADAR